ncbi:MAG: response regulator [Maricaulaceae bacterium]|jgi:two-component system chemotaxis response regulator CheY
MPAASAVRVLVVDDQLTMRTLIRTHLKELSITQIEEAVDGEDGLAKTLEFKPHLVLTDFNMPKLDGLGLLRAIRSHEATRQIAVFLLTGRADKDLVQRAVQFGVNNYMVKPFSAATLKEKIEEVFGDLT